jgi:hypothetical protein
MQPHQTIIYHQVIAGFEDKWNFIWERAGGPTTGILEET